MASSVAVLGGGISGLSAAYYLARAVPRTTKITLIEGKKRVGGWIESHQMPPQHSVPSSDDVLFESGTRTLRPHGASGTILLEMLDHLQLNEDHLVAVSKSDPAIKHKYIYYDHQINALPTDASSALFQSPPILKSVLPAALLEPFRPSRFKHGVPKDGVEDESIYSFIRRRFNDHVALHLLGAMTHGIYAGDIKALSVQSTFRALYEAERNHGSVVLGMMKKDETMTMRERGMVVRSRQHNPEWFSKMERMALLAFPKGMDTLPQTIRQWLDQCPNVEIITQDPIQSIDIKQGQKEAKICTASGVYYADHIISTLPSCTLDSILHLHTLPHLSHNPTADVAVVNLAYAPDVKLEYDGFGFLTPHRDSPYRLPVPGTLGVIFDSNVMRTPRLQLTAMIGGADWTEAFGNTPIDQLDPDRAYDTTLKIMREFLHLKERPEYSMVHLQKQCIPQYLVHHSSRMRELHHALAQHYGHLISVTGASYLGVSVPDCIKNSRTLVEELVVSGALGSREKVVTGLGSAVEDTSTEEMKDHARLSKGNVGVILHS